MDLITQLFVSLQLVISGFGEAIVTIFENITNIFFIQNSDGVSFTPVGLLSLCVFGIGLIWTGIRWLSRLIKLRG